MTSAEAASAANTLDCVNEGERERGGSPAADLIPRGHPTAELTKFQARVVVPVFRTHDAAGRGRSKTIELARTAHAVRLSLVFMRFLRVASSPPPLVAATAAPCSGEPTSPLHGQ